MKRDNKNRNRKLFTISEFKLKSKKRFKTIVKNSINVEFD
jgi:hypothetical protein